MIKIRTVCGNGIGSSLLCATRVQQICEEAGIEADVASIDFNNAPAQNADLYVTVKELAEQFPEGCNVAVIRSYMNPKKIKEDVLDSIINLSNK